MRLLVLIFGASIGSFTFCLLTSFRNKEKFWHFCQRGSFCPFCKHSLKWFDLIPILSYLLLFGRCRYCHRVFGKSYLLWELGFASLFLYAYCEWGLSLFSFLFLAYCILLIVLSYWDLLYLSVHLFLLIAFLFLQGLSLWLGLVQFDYSTFLFCIVLSCFLYYFYKDGMGLADYFFIICSAMSLSFAKLAIYFFLASTSALIVCLFQSPDRRISKVSLPFLPFLCFAFFLCQFIL
ncbi:prepilin peptidase [Vaginisenegalia massiliensis]|uniref:prepilin peptidase n=1 Tax=Vaginisenegalia massiliensis TaxID=2058294 RepID=UPI000F52FBEE|nr:A24 family peptidase [Vaginisenegalia massiliensis]